MYARTFRSGIEVLLSPLQFGGERAGRGGAPAGAVRCTSQRSDVRSHLPERDRSSPLPPAVRGGEGGRGGGASGRSAMHVAALRCTLAPSGAGSKFSSPPCSSGG